MSDDPTIPMPPTGHGETVPKPALSVPSAPVPPPFSLDHPVTEPLPTVATPTEPVPQVATVPPPPPGGPVGFPAAAAPLAAGEPSASPTPRSGKGKRIGMLAGAAVVALGLGAGGGYLARGGEVDDLTSERDELLIERNDLSAERTALTEVRDALEGDLSTMTADRDSLEAEIETMAADIAELEEAAAAAGEGVGACKDAADMADTIGDQWLTIWTLQNDWFETAVGSPEEAELDEQIGDAFDTLDEMYLDLDDLLDACDDVS